MQWFDGIDDPLTPPEFTLLAQLRLKKIVGNISLYPGYDPTFSPYPGHDQYSKLRARHDRKADLRHFQQQAESFAFDEIIVGEHFEWKGETLTGYTAGQPRRWQERFNLPAKKRAYDQLKANWLAAGLSEYSQDARLFLRQQATEKIRIIRGYNGPDVLDRPKAARLVAIARRLFKELRQYVNDDLQRLVVLTTKKKDDLTLRQAAIFYYYTQQPITENNVADLAAAKGHKSKTSGKQLFEKYAAWCELQESELPASTRELGALRKALELVRPHLTGKALAAADAYLKRVIEKKKRGL